jgi:hypothetical protein
LASWIFSTWVRLLVPVLDRGGPIAGGDVEVGHQERVAGYGVGVGEFGEG